MRALAEGLAGELHSVLLPGDCVGHVGHGRHPAMAPLQAEDPHGGSGRGQMALFSNSVILMKRRKEKATKTPQCSILVNADGKLPTVITNAVRGL